MEKENAARRSGGYPRHASDCEDAKIIQQRRFERRCLAYGMTVAVGFGAMWCLGAWFGW